MRRRYLLLIVFLGTACLWLVACGDTSAAAGSVEAGEKLFKQATIGDQAGCSTCHSLEPGVILVGPSLAGLASQAGSRVPGMSAQEYIRQSILEPNAYIVEGFAKNVMPSTWGNELSEEQINDLIAYLMTLE